MLHEKPRFPESTRSRTCTALPCPSAFPKSSTLSPRLECPLRFDIFQDGNTHCYASTYAHGCSLVYVVPSRGKATADENPRFLSNTSCSPSTE